MHWKLRPPAPPELATRLGVPRLLAGLLARQSITTSDTLSAYLRPRLEHLHDPFLLPDMNLATTRLLLAAQRGELVAVYGDFDADGVTATALLSGALKELGGRVITYLPHRMQDGHGLNLEAISGLRSKGASLLVTVDCGITAVEEIRAARELGMETIITDHHALSEELPPATATVSPRRADSRYPFIPLAGVGVAFKLSQALYQTVGRPPDDAMLELAALGTVADVVPLRGENHTLVRLGLDALHRTKRPGLLAMLSAARVPPSSITAESIGFTIAPRLNASGRLDTPETSLRLLTTSSTQEAYELAATLEHFNVERKRLSEQLTARAREIVQAQLHKEKLLFVEGKEFHPGINGLVAGTLAREFNRPAVVVSIRDGLAHGSGRSNTQEFDLALAFASCHSLFVRSGGHAAAAGFTADQYALQEICRRLQEEARGSLAKTDLTPSLEIDASVLLNELTGETFRLLQAMAPFGEGNPAPVFLTRDMEIMDVHSMGNMGQHLRLKLREARGATWNAVAFRMGGHMSPHMTGKHAAALDRGARLDVVYTIEADTFRGSSALRLLIRDFCAAGEAPVSYS